MCQVLRANLPIGKKRKVLGNVVQTSMSPRTSFDQSTAVPEAEEDSTCSVHMAERLSKLEQLFERFVCRKNSTNCAALGTPPTPSSPVSGSRERISKWCKSDAMSDVRSVTSIGDGIVSSLGSAGTPPTDNSSSGRKHGRQHLQYTHSQTNKILISNRNGMGLRIGLWWLCCPHSATQTLSSSRLTVGSSSRTFIEPRERCMYTKTCSRTLSICKRLPKKDASLSLARFCTWPSVSTHCRPISTCRACRAYETWRAP